MQPAATLPFYQVEDVLDRKLINNKVYYLVKWRDYPVEDATWEQARTLPYIKPLIRQYHIRNKDHRNEASTYLNQSVNLPRKNKPDLGSVKIKTTSTRSREDVLNSQKNIDSEQDMLIPRRRRPSGCQTRSKASLKDT